LQFFDGSNSLLKQVVITNVPPGTAASLSLKREEAPNLSVPRFAIRGVVRTSPVSATTGTNTPVVFAGCPVKTTMEIYNDDNGNTQLVTSDVTPINTPVLLPMVVEK